jgi:hypothetical protein
MFLRWYIVCTFHLIFIIDSTLSSCQHDLMNIFLCFVDKTIGFQHGHKHHY